VSRRGLRLARSRPDLLNQALPANIDLHRGKHKVASIQHTQLDLLRSQRAGLRRIHGPVSWEITPWCCHQYLYGDRAGCSTGRAQPVRASTRLKPCRALSCPVTMKATLFRVFPTGSKAKTSAQMSTGATCCNRAPPGPSAMVPGPGLKV